ncbi:unnamed protein product [Cunninghamella echinulata]
MKIFIKSRNTTPTSIDLNINDTIAKIKEAITLIVNINSDEQIVANNSFIIDDSKTINDLTRNEKILFFHMFSKEEIKYNTFISTETNHVDFHQHFLPKNSDMGLISRSPTFFKYIKSVIGHDGLLKSAVRSTSTLSSAEPILIDFLKSNELNDYFRQPNKKKRRFLFSNAKNIIKMVKKSTNIHL